MPTIEIGIYKRCVRTQERLYDIAPQDQKTVEVLNKMLEKIMESCVLNKDRLFIIDAFAVPSQYRVVFNDIQDIALTYNYVQFRSN